ncbi:MAG: patatin-like phospholipase family protein [Alphaproteobacteria bacterium]|nr:patatin-like phospholipase family protein [Alphaproteobacteria bacterium]
MTLAGGPRIGVALGGGSARGLAHIPCIEAMDELGLRPALIAGTSIGALIGAGWAAGMTGAALRAHALHVLGDMQTISGRIWSSHTRDLRKFFKTGLHMQLDPQDVVEAFLPDGFVEDFADLRTPLFAVATDFEAWNQVVFGEGPLRPAIAASIAVPSLFLPMRIDGRMLVDGGVANPLPLDVASAGADILIGIDVNGEPNMKALQRAPSPLDVIAGAAQIMDHHLTAHMMAAYPPDVYVRPHLQTFSAHEFWRVRDILKAGDRVKLQFKRQVDAAVEDFIAGRKRTPSTERPRRSR